MKKIIKQLHKLFPNLYVTIERKIGIHTSGSNYDKYRVYIEHNKIYPYSWSDEFKTLKELDEHLSNKIEGYKKVY